MSVLEAPTIGTDVLNEDTDDVDAFVSHLYAYPNPPDLRAFCGIHATEDQHAMMHSGPERIMCQPDARECPRCGAPICPVCVEKSPWR